MACDLLTAGLPKDCENNLGGLQKFWLTDKESVLSVTEANGEVSAIALASGAVFYDMTFNRNTSSFTEADTPNIENGSDFWLQTITYIHSRRSKEKRSVIALMLRKELMGIGLDQNGKYWLFGRQNGLLVTEITGGSGTLKGDLNGYTFTMVGEEPEQAPEIASSIIDSITE
jgi:hypothetical protein